MRAGALFLLTALAACGQPVPKVAERPLPGIVSLNPCSDAILAEVTRPGQLLAISHYSHSPASSSMDLERAKRFRAVSGSAEEVLALRPDVVVADAFLAPATRAALERSGIRIVAMTIPATVEQSRAQVLELARLAGSEDAGRSLNDSIDAALATAAASTVDPAIRAIVWQSGGIVPGRDTLIADLLARTGFALQTAEKGMGQADHLPLETLIADPPEALFVAGGGQSQEDRMLNHPALDSMAGTRRFAFDASLLWCGGPTIVRAAQWLQQVRSSL